MKKRFLQLWASCRSFISNLNDPELKGSPAGRILNSLTFLVVVLCLGLWIIAFLLLKDRLFTEKLSGTILTNLTCLTFFGGLVIAIFIGALAGNFLRRAFWKMRIRRGKRS